MSIATAGGAHLFSEEFQKFSHAHSESQGQGQGQGQMQIRLIYGHSEPAIFDKMP